MNSTYRSDFRLVAPPGGQRLPWPAGWDANLAQQQEIYEELLASQKRPAPAPAGKSRPLSAREITRDLAGWSPPQAGAAGVK